MALPYDTNALKRLTQEHKDKVGLGVRNFYKLNGIKPETRFWNKVQKTESCWNWQGSTDTCGYGQLRVNGKLILVHRFSFELGGTKIEKNMSICHTCDNRLCVNPKHLWVGTNAENVADKVAKGRHKTPLGEKHGLSKLTEEKVSKIRELYNSKQYFQREIADMFSVHPTCISQITRGRTWVKSQEHATI
jgi:hypothetical protein